VTDLNKQLQEICEKHGIPYEPVNVDYLAALVKAQDARIDKLEDERDELIVKNTESIKESLVTLNMAEQLKAERDRYKAALETMRKSDTRAQEALEPTEPFKANSHIRHPLPTTSSTDDEK